MPNCATCKHWDEATVKKWPGEYRPDADQDYRKDGAPFREGRWGICLKTVYRSSGYDDPESRALAHDHESYGAELLTRPDFGCNQWEPQAHA
jgi:hypothetical protein